MGGPLIRHLSRHVKGELLQFSLDGTPELLAWPTANSQTKNPTYQGFDSVRFCILRAGIPRSMGNFPERKTHTFLEYDTQYHNTITIT